MSDERRMDYFDIHKLLSEQGITLARIDERQNATVDHLERINGSIGSLWREMSATKKRVSMLERWRSGLAAVYTTALAALATWIKWAK